MNVPKLRSYLNGTTRPIGDYGDYIAVGSPLCHDLIKVDKSTMRLSYALDTFHKGREALKDSELLGIWDGLSRLIESGELQSIIDDEDDKIGTVEIYKPENGAITVKYAKTPGWPNSTTDGEMMYDNTHFTDYQKAVKEGIREHEAHVEFLKNKIEDLESDLVKSKEKLNTELSYLQSMTSLLKIKK